MIPPPRCSLKPTWPLCLSNIEPPSDFSPANRNPRTTEGLSVLNFWQILLAEATGREVLAMAGLVLMLFASGSAWYAYSTGWFRPPTGKTPPAGTPTLSLPAIGLALFLIGSNLAGKFFLADGPPREIEVEDLKAQCFQSLILWGLLLGSLAIVPQVSLRDYGFGFRKIPRQLSAGILVFLASFLPVYTLLILTHPFRSVETLHPLLKLLQNDAGPMTIFWIALAVAIAAPLFEELIYRVILQTTLARWLPAGAAIGTSAVIFSLVHGWPDMIPLFPLALLLGWVYHREKSYLAAVVAHSLFNTWMLAWALLVPAAG